MNDEYKHPVEQIAELTGGKIESAGILPDGSGFATISMPLPETHWIYNQDGSQWAGPAPMPFRMGTSSQASLLIQRRENTAAPFGVDAPIRMTREDFAEKIRVATKYAVRASTMCGKEMDFDPDAMVQNMVCAMLGYWTDTGLSSDEWENPPAGSGA